MRRKTRFDPNVAALGLFLVGAGLCAYSWPEVMPEGVMFAFAGALIPVLRFTLRELRRMRHGDKARRRRPEQPRGTRRRRPECVTQEEPSDSCGNPDWLHGMDANGDLPGAGDCICKCCAEMDARKRMCRRRPMRLVS